MFEYIFGKLAIKKVDYVAIDINGLAYKIYISRKTVEKLNEIGKDEKLYIFTNVKEDDISFYGFKPQNERELFRELITISGVGPKLAIAILSTFEVQEVIEIVSIDETKIFTKVPGLGLKKAQKIILDLKDKVKKLNISESFEEKNKNSQINFNSEILNLKEDLKLALDSLGYQNEDISKWITDEELCEISDISEVIKIVLQKIQSKKRK